MVQKPLCLAYQDLRKICENKTFEYLIYETDFFLQIIEHLMLYYYTDLIKMPEQHVAYENVHDKFYIYTIDFYLFEPLKSLLMRIDFSDVKLNQKIMATFVRCFKDLSKRMTEKMDEGFFIVPLHRVFSFYLTRLLISND